MVSQAAHMSRKPRTGRVACLIAAALVVSFAAPARAGELVLAPGTTHSEDRPSEHKRAYRVTLDRGQAADLVLKQSGAAALALGWMTSKSSASLTTEAGREATLRVTLLAESPTVWTIEIAPAGGKGASGYSIALGPAHAATDADRARAASAVSLAQAEALRHKGDKESAPQARAAYEASIKSAQSANDGCGLRQAYLALSGFEHDVVNAAGQKTAAQAALEQTCEDSRAEQALAERLLGSAFINQGDFAEGTSATERAVALFHQTGDTYQEGVALRNLGLAYAESGEVEKALATTRAALKAAETVGDGKLLALVRNDIAFMHNARGEFALAIDAYRKTLDALAANPYPMAEAVAWINLGIAYGQLGDGDQALAAYAKGEAVAAGIDCWSCLAEIEVDRGDDLLDAGQIAKAEAAYRRALDIAKNHELVRQHAEALRGLGRCAMAAQNWQEARTLLESARDELHRTHGVVNESVVYAMLGDLDNRLSRFDAAKRNYEQALGLAREASNTAWQAVAFASLARIAEQSGDLAAARSNIEQAIALIESERTRISAPDLRTSYFGTKRAYYALYIDILMQLDRAKPAAHHAADALIVAERARARELQDQLAERAINVDKDVDASMIAAEAEAQDQLHALAYQLSQLAADDAHRAELSRKIDEASRRLDESRGRIRAANPRYADLKHPTALSLDEIQHRLLDDKVSVLEYWLGDERSYLWIVTGDALRAFTLPGRAEIEKNANALRDALLAPAAAATTSLPMEQRAARDAADIDAVRARSEALAKEILPDNARSLLRREVAVVADGDLQALPLALLDPSRDAAAAYVYLPSIGTLRGLRALARTGAASNALAVIADPVFAADDERLRGHAAKPPEREDALLLRAASEAGLGSLPRLPHTRDEAQTILALADRKASWVALDFDANRQAALAAAWRDYAVVHFATHALLNARHPELSGIVLSLYDADGRAEDGFLRVNDIYNLDMPADLVVLSVCDSAVGRSVGGEGAANLARAFFYAGTRRVVASLWPVDDRASAAFMRAFYGALIGGGKRPQDALAEAQRQLRQNPRWRAPYFWSGYVLQGDWR